MQNTLPQGWYPVAKSGEVGKNPLRRHLAGRAIVLFRQGGKVVALQDRCPHRSAPLSGGKVVNGEIECPYHGWRFNGEGRCTAIPLHDGAVPSRNVPVLEAAESSGLVFVRHGKAGLPQPHVPFWQGAPGVKVLLSTVTKTSLIELTENAFEMTHSFFVHKGISRGLSGKARTRITMTLKGDDHSIEQVIEGEANQDGLMSRLLESRRTLSRSHLFAPAIVEMQYWTENRLTLVSTLYFTPETTQRQRGYAILQTPVSFGLGYLKALIFVPMFRYLIGQDKRMLKSALENWQEFGCPPHATSPVDVLRPHVETLFKGEPSQLAQREEIHHFEY